MAGAKRDEMAETASVTINDQERAGVMRDEIVWAVDNECKDDLCMHMNGSDKSVKPKMINQRT